MAARGAMGGEGPPAGVRVVESASFITGPYCGQLLADLGADVIKVEPPDGGDPFRSFAGSFYSPHFSRRLGVELRLTYPTPGEVGTVAPPGRSSATPWGNLQAPPTVGEHTNEILRELDVAD